ncbi:MAG TPA: hypothetical protein VKA65_12660 [Acidimicrobiales bacterium]|nr:hypothetical protein [Acidimicrobiales bacterium]
MQRYLLDIGRDDDDRVAGMLSRAGETPVAFSGWLELLRLLEDRAELASADDGRADT